MADILKKGKKYNVLGIVGIIFFLVGLILLLFTNMHFVGAIFFGLALVLALICSPRIYKCGVRKDNERNE